MAELHGPPDTGGPDPGPAVEGWDRATQHIEDFARRRAQARDQDVKLAELLPHTDPGTSVQYKREHLRMFAEESRRELWEDLAAVLEKHKVWSEDERRTFLESFDVKRKTYWTDYRNGGQSDSPLDNEHRFETSELAEIRLVSSELKAPHFGMHAPVLDLDFPCRLVPSTTDGHYHLYLDKPMSWEDYTALLQILMVVGILEEGYVSAALKRKSTFVRAPWEKKIPDADVGTMP